MSREDVVAAIRKDPGVLSDTQLREVLSEVMLDLIREGMVAIAQPGTRKEKKEQPVLVDGWISYAHAACLPGLTVTAIKSMVYRNLVMGGEGYLNAEDLLRHLTRPGGYNKQQAAAEALHRLIHS